jgi:ABC-type lipoprotein export system ATPase subunit
MVTHEQQSAAYADRVVEVADGRIVADRAQVAPVA